MTRGNREAGVRLLQAALEPPIKLSYSRGVFALGAESLAKLWAEEGQTGQAIEFLEKCSERKEKIRAAFSLRPRAGAKPVIPYLKLLLGSRSWDLCASDKFPKTLPTGALEGTMFPKHAGQDETHNQNPQGQERPTG